MFAKKSLGQNFLMHRQTAERIVDAAKLPEGALVLEIGPGTGMLTKVLLAKGYRVIAVEADNALVPQLEETFSGEGNLALIHSDIRAFNADTISEPYHVVANIPYYITGEIIRQFLTSTHQPRSMTLLVQKEVAERVARDEKGSILALSIKAFGVPSYAFTVPKGAFVPAPKVDSAVLHIADISRDAFPNEGDEERFFTVMKLGFAHKRKRLPKNLEEGWGRATITEAAAALGISPDARAEDIPLETWLKLSAELKSS